MGKLNDGFGTLITFATTSSAKLYETEVTPPGVEGGGPIDTSTFKNTAWRTAQAKVLKKLTQGSGVYAYDPECYTAMMGAINVNQLITVNFPEGDTLAFWGFIDSFKPTGLTDGGRPTATVVFEPTLTDESGDETPPEYTAAGA